MLPVGGCGGIGGSEVMLPVGGCGGIGHGEVMLCVGGCGWCQSVTAPDSLISMSAHKAPPDRWLLKPPSHIWATCHLGIARDPLKKARPKCALHYGILPVTRLHISPRILHIMTDVLDVVR